MGRWVLSFVLVMFTLASRLSAQTPPSLTNTSQIAWDQTADVLATAQGYSYRHYDDGSSTARVFTSFSCTGSASPFTCQAPFPASSFTAGSHTATLTAMSGTVESPKSASIAFTVPTPTPTVPMNPRIIGSLRLLFDGRLFLTYEDPDSQAVELGMKFQTDVAGYVAGVSFHKTPNNTGLHIGNLWSRAGSLLASATFRNETATGWQWAMFPDPVPVSPQTTYVVSYFAPRGHYTALEGGFAHSADNGVLHAPADGEDGPNGVYTYTSASAYPFQTYQATNYWVDVLFAPL